VAADLRFEDGGAVDQLLEGELVGGGGGAAGDVGDAAAQVEQFALLERRQPARREAAEVELRPEAVATPYLKY
jgi:hypothetical protein